MSLRRGVLNTTGLLLLAVAVFYSSRYWPQRLLLPPPEQPATGGSRPDYEISAFHAIDLDESGRLRYELTADTLQHFAQAAERAELANPDMIFYRNSSSGDQAPADPWELTAIQGTVTEGGDKLVLNGSVHVARVVDDPSLMQMTMDTDHLTVYGKQEIATTDAAVHLASDRVQLDGVGMQIDMKKGQMHLLSKVRGHYEPR